MEAPPPSPHSGAYLDDSRDSWWNPDFLALMAGRWELGSARSLLDVGCGLGHWSRLLFRHLAADARVVGIDREAEWVAGASAGFHRAYPEMSPAQARFVRGNATRLPFAADRFDVVTCQTVLIHLDRPERALDEMVRVVRPGGLVACVEPNNLFNAVGVDSLTATTPVERLVGDFAFWLRYERGKAALGQGDNSIGDRLPGLFAAAGLTDLRVHLSDKASPFVPPYDGPEQRALVAQSSAWEAAGAGPWDEADARTFVRAGGGDEAFFAAGWRSIHRSHAEVQDAIRRGVYHAAGGGLLYLVSGRKPA